MQLQNRKKARIKYSAQASVRSSKKGVMHGVVRDIGQQSLYVRAEQLFALDEIVEVEILLYGYDSQVSIKANGSVSRIDHGGVAIRFSSPLEWWPLFSLFPAKESESGDESFPDV